jgi:hypothetical protein
MKPSADNIFIDSALLCAAAYDLHTSEGSMMFMPAGLQTITPFAGGIGEPIQVDVQPSAVQALNEQMAALVAKGKHPYFDFEHADNGASFWPKEFYWSETPKPGIYARGEWSEDGQSGVAGKRWRKFSPVFHVDNKRAKPARIIANPNAKPNMGGLVNDPAFTTISALWAKNASGAQSTNQQQYEKMNEVEVKALQDKITELENEVARLKGEQAAATAKGETNELVAAKIEAKEASIRAGKLELESTELKAKASKQDAEILAQRQATAKAAVKAAVDRGAIAAKDADTIAQWEKDITESPDRAALLAKMQGSSVVGAPRVTSPASGVQVTGIAAKDAIHAYGAVLAKNKAIPLSNATAAEKGQLADQAAAIFSADLGKVDLAGAIMAADLSSDDLGVLTGALAMQATLPALLRSNPMLGSITNDFSSEPGLYGRTDNTRIVLRPAVQNYDATLNTDGRPKGWTTASPARTVDVPVTLDKYFAVPIVFGVTTLAGTARQLFQEQAPQAIQAMGSKLVDDLLALVTAANFNAYRGTTLAAGAVTSGSKTVTVTSTAAAFVGAEISGTGIPTGAIISAVVDSTTLTLSKAGTATNTGLTLTISGQGVTPTAYTTYARALADFSVQDLDLLAAAFDNNNVPIGDRFALLRPSYYRKLGSDSQVNALMQGTGDASYLTERRLPKISNFELLSAPYLPTGSNREGFVGHKASLVLKTRLPQDLSNALPGTSLPGSIATITDPGTGLSMALVSYYNMQGGFAEWRPELMAGVAVGDRRAGLVVTNA